MQELWEHQRREVEDHAFDENRMFVWDMRTGKSKAAIVSAVRNFEGLGPRRILVVAPAGVRDNWLLQEFPAHCPIPWAGFAWVSSRSRTLKFREEWEQFLRFDGLQVFAVNQEALRVAEAEGYLRSFVLREPCALIVDEAHHFGASGAKMTRRLKGLSKYCTWRRVLTGTPIDNSPLRFYSICNILKEAALGYTRVSDFNARYADWLLQRTRSGVYPKVMAYKNIDELVAKVRVFSSLVKREDCHDLPKVFEIDRQFFTTPEQDARIDDVKIRMRREELDIRAGITAIQAITSGITVDGPNPRMEALQELLDEMLDGKAIVWCHFTRDIDLVTQTFGRACVRYDGQVSRMERIRALDSFRKDPTVRLLVGQPKAGGEGLNLSCASAVVWYSHTYDALEYNQASDRPIQMGGSDIPCYRLIASNGWDKTILKALKAKEDVVDAVMTEWRKQDGRQGERSSLILPGQEAGERAGVVLHAG